MISEQVKELGKRHHLIPSLSMEIENNELKKRYHFEISNEFKEQLINMDDFKELHMKIEDVAEELFNYYLMLYEQRNEFYI